MDAEAERQFPEFVAARSAALFRSAYLLTGQREAAEDLVDVRDLATGRACPRSRDGGGLVRRPVLPAVSGDARQRVDLAVLRRRAVAPPGPVLDEVWLGRPDGPPPPGAIVL